MNALILFFIQDTTKSLSFVLPEVPSGFNYFYLAIFAGGMFVHFLVHMVKSVGGWSKIGSVFNASFFDNFASWFGNKFHLTLVSGAAAAIIGTAAQWNLNVPFATLNPLGIAVAIASGYIGDSMFGGGTVAAPQGSTPIAPVVQTLPPVAPASKP